MHPIYSPQARRQLKKLASGVRIRMIEAAQGLAENPRPRGYVKLVGLPGYRIEVGHDHRLVYDIDDKAHTVTILEAGLRRDMYKPRK